MEVMLKRDGKRECLPSTAVVREERKCSILLPSWRLSFMLKDPHKGKNHPSTTSSAL